MSRTRDLKRGKRQNDQLEPAFTGAGLGEAQVSAREGTEPLAAGRDTESPASTERLMEEVCERENLKRALRRVKVNRGSGGVDGMTVQQLPSYLSTHWPDISGHQAVAEAQQYIAQGHEWVVDLDLEKFFDRVNHDRLMSRVAQPIADKRLLRLIRAYLNAGVMEDGLVRATEEGTPQGGPLSPL